MAGRLGPPIDGLMNQRRNTRADCRPNGDRQGEMSNRTGRPSRTATPPNSGAIARSYGRGMTTPRATTCEQSANRRRTASSRGAGGKAASADKRLGTMAPAKNPLQRRLRRRNNQGDSWSAVGMFAMRGVTIVALMLFLCAGLAIVQTHLQSSGTIEVSTLLGHYKSIKLPNAGFPVRHPSASPGLARESATTSVLGQPCLEPPPLRFAASPARAASPLSSQRLATSCRAHASSPLGLRSGGPVAERSP